MSRKGGSRITFANENVPKVLGSVLSILADANLNVIDMLNRSRNELAYNIVDVEGEIGDELKTQIASVEGVISVRVI